MSSDFSISLQQLLAPYWSFNKTFSVNITDIQNDSRCVKSGDLFIAYAGAQADGRKYIDQAWERGASAILVETDSTTEISAEYMTDRGWLLCAPHVRTQLGAIAARFFREPSRRCAVIGVTGTNGKTSLCFLVAQALQALGHSCAIMGTVGQGFLHQLTSTANTTPDALAIQRQLAQWIDQGATHVAMEVSSHGIHQGRVDAVQFDTVVFTQIGRDHLDYHGTLEAYVQTKTRLFQWPGLRHAVINGDDVFSKDFLSAVAKNTQCTRYGLQAENLELRAEQWQPHEQGSHAVITRKGKIVEQDFLETALWGQFNFYNLLAALSVLLGFDVALEDAVRALSVVKAPPGRLEKISDTEQPCVLVDYAHTPDALESVLLAIHQHVKARLEHGGKLVCIFGCGGDRDVGKRSIMGQVATRYADKVVLTMDNPRSEDPLVIVQHIQSGCDPKIPCEIILDRAEAIHKTIQNAGVNDIVIIAGKGHETTQIIGADAFPSDDRVFAHDALIKRG